ncbi:MAG TPA: PHP domain-containing protein [Actinomycetota bacterium]|jgi:predicted metal-dependent phosphoesterase TrpH|nr:PHP domain-containing protein [Actinomycetota bacterium]
MAGIDLHTHTNRSDGTFAPPELVKLASQRGLEVVAITDHDTTEGLEEATRAGRELGVEVVPGVELSAEHQGTSVHVLCYWMDPENEGLQAELVRLRSERFLRGEVMVEKLRSLGYPVSFERVREIAGSDNIVRPHVAQALVEAGVVADEEESFDRLIGDEGPAYVPKHALAPLDALALVRQAGGACVLAHPGMWSAEAPIPEDLIEAMAEAGMAGLEADHSDHTPEQREHYRGLAKRLGLVATGGSDCHGTRYDPVRLGSVTTDPDRFRVLRALAHTG